MWDIRRWGIAKEVLNAPFLGLKMKPVEGVVDGKPAIVDYILYEGENIKWRVVIMKIITTYSLFLRRNRFES